MQLTARSGRPRILRLSSRNLCSSLVSSSTSAAGEGHDVERDRRGEHRGVRELDGASVEGQRRRVGTDLGDLLVQLVDARAAGARHRLVRRHDEAAQPGLGVERLEHRHAPPSSCSSGWRRCPSGWTRSASGLTSLTTSGHVGIHAPRRGVVDDDRAGGGDARRQARVTRWRLRRRGRCRDRRSRRSSASSTAADSVADLELAANRAGRGEDAAARRSGNRARRGWRA